MSSRGRFAALSSARIPGARRICGLHPRRTPPAARRRSMDPSACKVLCGKTIRCGRPPDDIGGERRIIQPTSTSTQSGSRAAEGTCLTCRGSGVRIPPGLPQRQRSSAGRALHPYWRGRRFESARWYSDGQSRAGSSAVERLTVNQVRVGSSPTLPSSHHPLLGSSAGRAAV